MKLGNLIAAGALALRSLAGCGSDSPATESPPPAGQDAGPDTAVSDGSVEESSLQDGTVDETAPPDAAEEASTPDAAHDAVEEASTPDASGDAPEPDGSQQDDAGPDAALDAMADQAVVDGAPEAASNRPPGQCKADGDCGSGQTCTMTAPGGLCAGCGTENDCPDPLEFECFMATCQRTCSDDVDCPEGYECKSVGRCGLISCSTSCPAPYVCDGGFCRRPHCSSTPPACPTGMTCGQDNVCVEQ